jgi:hypothetical protein
MMLIYICQDFLSLKLLAIINFENYEWCSILQRGVIDMNFQITLSDEKYREMLLPYLKMIEERETLRAENDSPNSGSSMKGMSGCGIDRSFPIPSLTAAKMRLNRYFFLHLFLGRSCILDMKAFNMVFRFS